MKLRYIKTIFNKTNDYFLQILLYHDNIMNMQQQSTLNIDDKIETTGPAPNSICSNNYSNLNINLSSATWFEPDTLARLKCVIDLAHQHKMAVSIIPPNKPDFKDYAGRMGLLNDTLIDGKKYEYLYSKHESNSFFPLLKIKNDHNDTLQERCLKVIENTLGHKPIELSDHFSEIADNVYFILEKMKMPVGVMLKLRHGIMVEFKLRFLTQV